MSDQQTTSKSEVRKEGDREIIVERVFDAPRDVVFKAFTDPELIPEWWGPHGTETVVDKLDAKTGGDWRFIQKDSDGNEYAFRGTFREITPPERIAWTFEWDGMPGYVSVDIVEFEDLGEQTQDPRPLAVLPPGGARRHARGRHGEGHERELRASGRAPGEAEELAVAGGPAFGRRPAPAA